MAVERLTQFRSKGGCAAAVKHKFKKFRSVFRLASPTLGPLGTLGKAAVLPLAATRHSRASRHGPVITAPASVKASVSSAWVGEAHISRFLHTAIWSSGALIVRKSASLWARQQPRGRDQSNALSD